MTIASNIDIQGPSDNSITGDGGSVAYAFATSHIFIVDSGASVILRRLVTSNGYPAGDGGGSVTATYVSDRRKVKIAH